jgi:hypothetical protein
MLPCFNLPPGALLHRGGVDGANHHQRRAWRSVGFAPTPPGIDTARPAGRTAHRLSDALI